MALTTELQAAAQQLGTLLSETEPLKLYRQAERRLQADLEAQALLDRFQTLGDELRARQSQGQPLSEEEINNYRHLQADIGNHPTLRAFFEAGAEVKRYLQAINQDLSQHLGLDFARLGYDPHEHQPGES